MLDDLPGWKYWPWRAWYIAGGVVALAVIVTVTPGGPSSSEVIGAVALVVVFWTLTALIAWAIVAYLWPLPPPIRVKVPPHHPDWWEEEVEPPPHPLGQPKLAYWFKCDCNDGGRRKLLSKEEAKQEYDRHTRLGEDKFERGPRKKRGT